MKKITAILTVSAILLAAMLAACADPSKAGAKSAGAVTDTQTETAAETGLGSDTEPLEIPTQTEAAPDSTTAAQPETAPKEPEDTTPVPERGVTLNTDLLGEYKMTYAELTVKHGKLVDFSTYEGGAFYKFENGYGYYWIYIPDDGWEGMVELTDPEGGFEYRYIPGKLETYLCRGIDRISPDKLFIGDYETLGIEEISKLDGLRYLGTGNGGIVDTEAYCSHFIYKGWNDERVEIDIYHTSKNKIDLNSKCEFFLHPQSISEPPVPSEDLPPVPERGVTLNTDLLGEYKMTYAELKAKYGKITGYEKLGIGTSYLFENGYGYYWIDLPKYNSDRMTVDPDGGFEYYSISADEEESLCRGIFRISPDKLFIGDYETLGIDEISKLEGIRIVHLATVKHPTQGTYSSMFTYEGWDDNKYSVIKIYHKNKNMIDLTSECEFYIAPIFIDEEERLLR